MRCGVLAVQPSAVGRNVGIERGLARRREDRKFEAEPAITAIAAAAAAAEADDVRSPDARDVLRLEWGVWIENARITRARRRRWLRESCGRTRQRDGGPNQERDSSHIVSLGLTG